MCEPATPLDVLTNLKFAVSSMAEIAGTPGSYEREMFRSAAKGVRADLDWCIAQLEAANEGHKNMGIHPYQSKVSKP